MTLSDSINLARRLSARNEPDLIQETYVAYSKEECEKMVLALSGSLDRLPKECKMFVGAAKKKEGKTEKVVDPFEGMYSGQRAAAHAEKLKGRPTQAVLQRRYTKAPK